MSTASDVQVPLNRTLGQAFVMSHPTRVLLAEDNADMRELVRSALCRDGYEVVAVDNGVALLNEIFTSPLNAYVPEVVISDIRMPGSNGLEVLAELRKRTWETPVILITAFGDEETHAEAERLGAVVIDKPFDLDDLRSAVINLRRLS